MYKKYSMPVDMRKNLISAVLITVAAFVIYSNSFDASFHFDDNSSIVENYAIHRFDVKDMFRGSSRPVLDLTFALNYYFGKLEVFGYHLVNLLLHISNGMMLYFILLWTIRSAERRAQSAESKAQQTEKPYALCPMPYADSYNRVPLYASLIFIAHPVQTQAVTYIVSRSSVLATFFYLLTLFFFIKANSSLITRYSVMYFTGAFFAFFLGLGSKQEAATIPFLLLLYDYYFISDGSWSALKKHSVFYFVMFFTLAIGIYWSFSLIQAYVSFDYAKGVNMPQADPITSVQYFLTQLHVIPYYLKLLFIPTNLNLDYDWPITRNVDLTTILFFLLLSAIIILAVKLFRKERLLSFGIIWFFVTLSVTSSFVIIYDVIFEHRLYLPSIGFAVVLAVLINRISSLKSVRGY